MNIFLIVLFLLQVLTNTVAPKFVKTIMSVNIPSGSVLIGRPLISTSGKPTLRRTKRDSGNWNRMRNTLSKVSRTRTNPPSNPKSLRDQIEQHYRNNAHQHPSSHNGQNTQTDVEQQFLMEFFFWTSYSWNSSLQIVRKDSSQISTQYKMIFIEKLQIKI